MRISLYVTFRLLLLGLQIFGMSALLFSAYAWMNYDPAVAHSGLGGPEAIEAEQELLGTGVPYDEQFWRFWEDRIYGDCETFGEVIANMTSGDCEQNFGISWEGQFYARDFQDAMFERLFNTMLFFLVAFLIYTVTGTLLGVISAIYEKSWFDTILRVLSSILGSVPPVLVFIIFVRAVVDPDIGIINPEDFGATGISDIISRLDPYVYLSTIFKIADPLENGNLAAIEYFHENYWMLIFPVLGMVIVSQSFLYRLVRTLIIQELRAPYIRTAKAKGLNQREIITRHAIPNAMSKIINAIAVTIPISITNGAIVEMIFGYNGIAKMLIEASQTFDFPIVHAGSLLLVAISSILMTTSDVVVHLVDPRLKERT